VVRFPKGTVGGEAEAVGRVGGMDMLYEPPAGVSRDVLLAGAGPMAVMCVQAAARLADQGIGVTVVDPRWVKPVDPALAGAAAEHRLVVTVEDNGRVGGFGDAVCRLLRDAGVATTVQTYGLPQEFLTHAKREEILEEVDLVPQHLARRITEAVARLTPELADHPQA
jgi:1-deoxy-D-xylulose-5-phosphate synthase